MKVWWGYNYDSCTGCGVPIGWVTPMKRNSPGSFRCDECKRIDLMIAGWLGSKQKYLPLVARRRICDGLPCDAPESCSASVPDLVPLVPAPADIVPLLQLDSLDSRDGIDPIFNQLDPMRVGNELLAHARSFQYDGRRRVLQKLMYYVEEASDYLSFEEISHWLFQNYRVRLSPQRLHQALLEYKLRLGS